MSDNVQSDNSGPDIFVGELTRIERLGNNRRLIFTMPDPISPSWRVIVAKLIVPADYMLPLAQLIGSDGRKPMLPPDPLSAMEVDGPAN